MYPLPMTCHHLHLKDPRICRRVARHRGRLGLWTARPLAASSPEPIGAEDLPKAPIGERGGGGTGTEVGTF